ncbi:B12-binding domain-containing radical SAM protein [Planosporangium thailandense]|uniref:B12-binding domain-containing radical SAM protein n=1 Tax=Planosporangium thailandense TaxID=765197 RepID=A0ABX0XZF6_9ACTN|nr:radical SAM protein [Planosporangium thailandense]NJC70735.1 B12-binding domain-containing radical SAM protein [Planosporangium thailandense]
MRICLLIPVPDREMIFVQQPVEALYAATILAEAGHDPSIVDTRVEDPVLDRPELIFLITQTYDLTQCNSISLNNAAALVTQVRREHPGVPIVAVGMHASLEPEMTKRDLGVDASLPGELEASIPWFVAAYTEDVAALTGPLDAAPQTVDPATLPVPDYSLIDVARYWSEVIDPATGELSNSTNGLLFANRGCPYTCSYCFVWFGAKIRRREPAQVVAEMRAQLEHGVRDFFFLDYTFTIVPTWVRELCDLIRAEGLDVRWLCQTRVERVNPELLATMKAAGCMGIYYGVESPWIAEVELDKPSSRELIEKAIRDTAAAGIHPLVFILFGAENGDPEKARELYDFLAGLPGTFLPSVLLPRPFTGLWSRHTAGQPKPTTWAEYDRIATRLRDEMSGRPEVARVHEEILRLPNFIGNVPKPEVRTS